jgi:uncharacterized LabA/DUF88 family protein
MDSKGKKIYAFIDSQNLNLSVENDIWDNVTGRLIYSGWKLDFKRFFVHLKEKHNVDIAFLFIGRVKGMEALYSFLEGIGYLVIYKPTLEYRDNGEIHTKGNVDAELVLHAMIEFPNYDKAIIVSGDGDYFCLVEYLEKHNKLSHIIIPNRKKYSALLGRYRPYLLFVNDLQIKLERR